MLIHAVSQSAFQVPCDFQDDLDDFTDGASASRRLGDQMDRIFDLGRGVGRTGGQADGFEHGQIGRSSPTKQT